jgi:ABC-type sugar transport system substrate-binding protein
MRMFRDRRIQPVRLGAMLIAIVAALTVGVSTSGASKSKPSLAMITAASDQNAFQEMADGAKVAAQNNGDKLSEAAPPSVTQDATTEVQEFQSAESTAKDGIAVMTTDPPDFAQPEAQAEANGIPVVAVDACSLPTANVPTCVANDNQAVGFAIGKKLTSQIPKNSAGTVVVGDDIPQLQLLGYRIQGMENALKAYDPNLQFTQTYNVTADPTSNQQQWSSLVSQYPNAVAYIAPGDQDAVSFVNIEKQTGKHYLVIACDVDPVALKGVQQGQIYGLGDPEHFLKGYFAIWLLSQHAKGKSLIKGWWNPGDGTITKSNIKAIMKRETSNATRYAFYKSIITKETKNPSKYIKSLSAAQEN